MPDTTGRHKVGDVDEEGKQALKDAISGKPTPPVKEAPKKRKKLPGEEKSRERRYGPEGKGLDELVDEAVKGASKGPASEY